MNKSLLIILEKTIEINSSIMSNNGYYYYDLMLSSGPGYMSASDIVFYSEDENIIKKLNELRFPNNRKLSDSEVLSEIKIFILDNQQYLMTLSDAQKISSRMYEPMAYMHLKSDVKETFAKMLYGGLHLIQNEEILIFRTHTVKTVSPELNTLLSSDLKDDFENKYFKVQQILNNLYESKLIKEEFRLKDKAAANIISKIKGFSFHLLNDFQKSNLNIIEQYNLSFGKQIQFTSNIEENLLLLSFEINKENFIISIPHDKKSNLTLNINEKELIFDNIMSLLISLDQYISNNKILAFVEKNKLKIK